MTTTRLVLLLQALVRLVFDIAARRRRPTASGAMPPADRSGPPETGGA
jgi:hypothetical protein